MTYESLHDDDDFRVNWCRNMDSFLFICAQDDHAAPHLLLCASRAVRRRRAVRRQQAVAATGLHAATGLTASTLQPSCPLTGRLQLGSMPTPAIETAATDLPLIILSTWLIWSAIQQTNRPSKSRHICIHDPQCSYLPFFECDQNGMCPF
jgi:hypothetical protein